MKRVAFILLTLFAFHSYAQDKIVLKSFVKETGQTQLRWAPTTPTIMQAGLKRGYVLIKESNGISEEVNILPIGERKQDFAGLKDSFLLSILEFAEEFSDVGDQSKLDQGFALMTLAASTNKEIAKILGVYFEDDNSNKTNYTVYVKGDQQNTSATLKVNPTKKDENPNCSEFKGSSRIDLKQANLEWEAQQLNEFYGGYWLLKSLDNKVFEKLNETPLFHFTSQYEKEKTKIEVVDTAVSEGNTYYYQVQPINHFGDNGKESNVVEVYIQKRLSGLTKIDTVVAEGTNRLVTGMYEGVDLDRVSEYHFFKSDSINGPFELIESKKKSSENFEFTYDCKMTSGDKQYFKVMSISEDGDTSKSYAKYFFTYDQIPPGMPLNFEGKIDSNGVASLKWNNPDDNDIQGYRVFRANTLKEEFVEITQVLRTELYIKDTLALDNLTSEIYYKVKAVDNNYNSGPPTDPLLLMKPDTIAPIPGVIKLFEVKEEGVYLKWANSNSADLEHQFLVRVNENRPDTLLRFKNGVDTILDASGRLGLEYQYIMLAVDKSGNIGQSEPIRITYEIGYRPAPKFIETSANREDKLIMLQWEKVMEPIYSIQIYRAKNEGKFRLYKTLRENIDTFEDSDLSINNEYHYKIKINFESGISSKMSESKSIMY